MKVMAIPNTRRRGPYLYQQSRYGLISRARFIPANPRTPAQLRLRHFLARLAAGWNALTPAEHHAWNLVAWQQPPRVRAGRSKPLNGFNLFFKINSTRLLLGAPEVSMPPPKPTFDPLPVSGLILTHTGGTIALKLTVSGAPQEVMMLWGAPPCSPGRDIARRMVYLGTLTSPAAGAIDITALYAARFGSPPADSKVFVRVNQNRDGWNDTAHPFAAIVPAAT
jgi:hypothetical protein